MPTTVLRGDVRELIAYAFFRVGYRPRESLVVLGMDERDRTLGAVLRIDLPSGRGRSALVETVLRSVAATGERRVFVLVVSAARSHAGLVRLLRRRLAREGVDVVDAVLVGERSYGSYLCDDDACCPPGGRPLGDLATTQAAALMVAEGHVLAAAEADLVADVVPHPPDLRGGTTPDAGREEPLPSAPQGAPDGSALGAAAARAATLARWRALLDPRDPRDPHDPDVARDLGATAGAGGPSGDLSWLGVALDDLLLRDAIILTLVPRTGRAPEDLLAGTTDLRPDRLFTHPPDRDLLERARLPLAQVARTRPPGARAEALAVLAWAAWWAGSGARARLLAALALQDRPGHRLATLVDELLLHGVAPDWTAAAARRAAADGGSREGTG